METRTFNGRFQPTQIQAGSLLTLGYSYSANNNNGNLLTQTISRPSVSFSATQTYNGYDGVNRLTGTSESGSGAWTESEGYDNFGNRWVSATTGLPTPGLETPIFQSWFNGNNQINTWSYDIAGNVTSIAGMQRTFAYDGEGRQMTATINGTPTTYTYDGDGRRVTKTVSAGTTTTYVYDAIGQLAAEYGGTASFSGTTYLTQDHLGSTRLITSSAGAMLNCYDYFPFGGDISQAVNGRPSCYPANPNPADGATLKFTSKERDSESGLDWFGFRYMSSAQGRFTNPDEPFAGWDQHDPQSFNLYSYVQNNPLRYTDPNGRDVQVCLNDENGNQTCHTYNDAQYQSIYQAQNGKQGINLPGNFPAPTGDITCGGTVCGSATYVPGKGDAQDLTVSFALADLGGRAIGAALKGAWSGIVGLFGRGAEQSTVVIGKMADLNKGLGPGERELDLPNLSDPKLNWAQNSSRLREVTAEGNPIRDASAEPLVGGRPGSNTGFLRAERNLLENHGWTYSGGYWNPPSK